MDFYAFVHILVVGLVFLAIADFLVNLIADLISLARTGKHIFKEGT